MSKHLKHVFVAVLISIAAFLRLWQLSSHAIFFGDAARDLKVAQLSLAENKIPLLGIPSSVPRFHQGPLSIWIQMVTMQVSGPSLLAVSIVFAVIGILGVIALYELLVVTTNFRVAFLAVVIMACSPLAIAHARMPYHITPIPLCLVLFLASLVLWWQGRRRALFWVGLSFGVLFQFELALTPLSLLIGYVAWQKWRQRKKKQQWSVKTLSNRALQLFGGLAIGVLPQVIYDVQHRFEHFGGFAVWLGYRVAIFLGYKSSGLVLVERLRQTWRALAIYFSRIWSVEPSFLTILCLVVLVLGLGLVAWQLYHRQKVAMVMQLSWIGFMTLLAAFFIHGSPSEAYFPPMIVLSAIVMGYALAWLWSLKFGRWVVITFVLFYGVMNSYQIFQDNFLVSTGKQFSYGASPLEQRQVISLIDRLSSGNFRLETTRPDGKFPTFFDNYRWMAAEKGLAERETGRVFFIEAKDSPLQTYPNFTRYAFTSVDVYVQ